MNTMYKMLWIDDSEDFIETAQELIEDTVKQNNMMPQLIIYSQFEKYKEKELDNFDIDVFNLYDQIIIDYALSGTTGDKIIRDLRSRNIYTDIVFYSSNFETMKEEMKNSSEHLDGVFFSTRENITSTVDKVIKKNLKREYSIANIRGLIMDSTSEFDYICRTTTLALFDKLSDEKKEMVVSKAKEFVGVAESNSKNNFSKLSSKNGYKFLKDAMESVDYVMNNKDRYAIMALVVREFDSNPNWNDEFAEKYQNELIKPRNDLAHNKLYYGSCQKKIHIARHKQTFNCNGDCENCTSKYSIETCEELRKLMYYYHQILNQISEKTDVILAQSK